MHWLRVVAASIVAVAMAAAPLHRARAADADERLPDRRDYILDAVGPPTMPGLSHAGWAFGFDYLIASAAATDRDSGEELDERALSYGARWALEMPLIDRVWYLGITSEIAAASVPSGEDPQSGGSTLVLGNPELWTRALWSSDLGLAAGGGVGLVVPVPRTFSLLEQEVVRSFRTVQPEGFNHYLDLALTIRPFFDLRHVTGPVTLQMRQGIDFSILVRDRAEEENRYDLTAFATAYVGVNVIDALTLGLEVAEVYQITADTTSPGCASPCDQQRVQVTLSPVVRLHLPGLSPAISALFPLSTPLRSEVASYYAARLHLDVLF